MHIIKCLIEDGYSLTVPTFYKIMELVEPQAQVTQSIRELITEIRMQLGITEDDYHTWLQSQGVVFPKTWR
jgi:hypothetical protein